MIYGFVLILTISTLYLMVVTDEVGRGKYEGIVVK